MTAQQKAGPTLALPQRLGMGRNATPWEVLTARRAMTADKPKIPAAQLRSSFAKASSLLDKVAAYAASKQDTPQEGTAAEGCEVLA